jgi:hypothetical protein
MRKVGLFPAGLAVLILLTVCGAASGMPGVREGLAQGELFPPSGDRVSRQVIGDWGDKGGGPHKDLFVRLLDRDMRFRDLVESDKDFYLVYFLQIIFYITAALTVVFLFKEISYKSHHGKQSGVLTSTILVLFMVCVCSFLYLNYVTEGEFPRLLQEKVLHLYRKII